MIEIVPSPHVQTTAKPILHFRYPDGVMPPTVYVRRVLGMSPYWWQDEALESFGQRIPTVAACCNESGKTALVFVGAQLWFLDSFPNAKFPFTSASWTQLQTQFRPALRQHEWRFPSWRFLETEWHSDAKSFGFMFSTDNPGRAEGHHATDPILSPLAYGIDEAKTVPDGIFGSMERCNPQYTLVMSSTGQSAGQFFRAFGKDKQFYHTIRIKSTDCPHLDPAIRERDKIKLHRTLFLSKHDSEFAEDDDFLVIKPSELTACMENPPRIQAGSQVAFCDFAAGGDENVLAIRRGNHVWIAAAWREKDTVQASRRFVRLFEENDLSPTEVFADASGLGTVMIDEIAEHWHEINRVHNGATPLDPQYANRGSEIWFDGAAQIRNRKVNIEADAIFFEQATTRRSEWSATGKLRVQSKEKMAELGIDSPDRADAILGATSCGPHLSGVLSNPSDLIVGRSRVNY